MIALRVASLFSGIGGIDLGFQQAGFEIVWANEFDKDAAKTYRHNFGPDYLVEADIRSVDPGAIPDFDVLVAGFPCQPFSVAGLKKGFEDTRGTLFFNIANIVKSKIETGCPPRVLFLENVRGLKSHDNGRTLQVILATLDELGYDYSYEVLNAKYFGVPQNRLRIFCVSKKIDLNDNMVRNIDDMQKSSNKQVENTIKEIKNNSYEIFYKNDFFKNYHFYSNVENTEIMKGFEVLPFEATIKIFKVM